MFSDQLFSLSTDYLVEKIQPHKDARKFFKKFNLNISVVKPKEQQPEWKLLLNIETDSTKTTEDLGCYENFINYLQYSCDKYVTPLYTNVCKIGDVVSLEADVDEEFFFDNDTCTVSVVVSIPNNHKQNWQLYLANKYKELSKFDSYFDRFIFYVRDYKVQKVAFKFNFEMEQEQTIKYLIENGKVQQQAIGFWLSAFNDVEKKVRSEKCHTNKIPVKKVMTKYGPRLQFCDEDIKIKL